MHRRKFIQNTLGSALALAAAQMPRLAFGQAQTNASPTRQTTNPSPVSFAKLRGVNLGGWLVLEKWMVPSVYRGTDAEDEYSLCLKLGDAAAARLNKHRETFITAEDFRWIKEHGLNAVRLPVGYWALEAPKPYVSSDRFIDFALEQAQRNDLKLLLDLHGAPGSQNGWDHSGRSGEIGWDKDPDNIKETVRVLETFAQKYGNHPALFGIELLNEPRDVIPVEILKNFYQEAYAAIRKYANPNVAVVFHDSFRAMAWKDFMKPPEYANVLIDTHLYQSFSEADRRRNAQEQIIFALNRKSALDKMQQEELPTFVGEWSLALPNRSLDDLSAFQGDLVNNAYADAQLLSFESTRGWFFWSYKLEHDSEWNFRHCVNRNWLPETFPV
ncbi:MAG TPA: glycoside hydrolase family 5 protein [Verrucomicrobiae bacterium]|nr:glycoside hydrolase family 5 protein [Verrucomicrobiae bacterium]